MNNLYRNCSIGSFCSVKINHAVLLRSCFGMMAANHNAEADIMGITVPLRLMHLAWRMMTTKSHVHPLCEAFEKFCSKPGSASHGNASSTEGCSRQCQEREGRNGSCEVTSGAGTRSMETNKLTTGNQALVTRLFVTGVTILITQLLPAFLPSIWTLKTEGQRPAIQAEPKTDESTSPKQVTEQEQDTYNAKDECKVVDISHDSKTGTDGNDSTADSVADFTGPFKYTATSLHNGNRHFILAACHSTRLAADDVYLSINKSAVLRNLLKDFLETRTAGLKICHKDLALHPRLIRNGKRNEEEDHCDSALKTKKTKQHDDESDDELLELVKAPTNQLKVRFEGQVYICDGPDGVSKQESSAKDSEGRPSGHAGSGGQNRDTDSQKKGSYAVVKATIMEQSLTKELARFRTFSSMQTHVPDNVWITRVAAAGFYYVGGTENTVRCAFCNTEASMTEFEGRDPATVHRGLSPSCPHLLQQAGNLTMEEHTQHVGHQFQIEFHRYYGLSQSENVHQPRESKQTQETTSSNPDTAQRAGSSSSGADASLSSPASPRNASSSQALPASQRLPAHVPNTASSPSARSRPVSSNPAPASIVAAPANPSNRASNHVVSASPATLTQGAPAPQETANTSEAPATSEPPPRQTVTYSQLGIYTEEPKRPDFAIASSRMGTFTGWPHTHTHPPEEMAEAGFYYVPGQTDLVRCFYCKGGLRSWATHLRPWVEHARFYPKCPFVGQVKGQEFVEVVQELKARQEMISAEEVEEELQRRLSEREGTAAGATAGAAAGADAGADDANGTQAGNANEDELESENQNFRDSRTCKICQVNEVSILFLPCGHLVSCAQCAPALRTCAICRQRVKGRVRVISQNP